VRSLGLRTPTRATRRTWSCSLSRTTATTSSLHRCAFDKRGAHGRIIDGGEGSAAESAQRLAPEATVVGAFHNVSAVLLWGDDDYLDEDVLVVGDVVEAKQVAMELARCVVGREGIDAGKLRLARQLEPLTAVLISINRKYKVHSGVRITGLPAG
jgi:NADPH-dependent F420 reductase